MLPQNASGCSHAFESNTEWKEEPQSDTGLHLYCDLLLEVFKVLFLSFVVVTLEYNLYRKPAWLRHRFPNWVSHPQGCNGKHTGLAAWQCHYSMTDWGAEALLHVLHVIFGLGHPPAHLYLIYAKFRVSVITDPRSKCRWWLCYIATSLALTSRIGDWQHEQNIATPVSLGSTQ